MRSLHTPQQETNVAYNPGVTFRGGEFIAQGISQAGNAISAGLQRYAQNREESAALDMSFQTRAQPLLEEMQKFSAKDGQVSPAAGLVDKGADWHKFSSSQKKAFLADVVLMGDKQDRARRQQQEDDFRKAAAKLQQDQFTQLTSYQNEMQRLQALSTGATVSNIESDNTRANKRLSMDEQNFANLQETRRAKLESDALMAGHLAEFQRLAAEPTGPSRMGGDAAAALISQPGTRLPDFSRYGPQDTQLTRQPLSLDRVLELGTQTGAAFNPKFADYAKLYQGAKLDPIGQMNAEAALSNARTNAAEAARRAEGNTSDKPTITITEKNGDRTVIRKVTEAEFAALPQPVQRDAILDGQIAELEAMEKRGAKKAELTDNGVSQPMFGGQPIGDLLARLRARRGGGAAAPGPAAEKPITTKAEFDALPSGATYKGKDGRTYQKP